MQRPAIINIVVVQDFKMRPFSNTNQIIYDLFGVTTHTIRPYNIDLIFENYFNRTAQRGTPFWDSHVKNSFYIKHYLRSIKVKVFLHFIFCFRKKFL